MTLVAYQIPSQKNVLTALGYSDKIFMWLEPTFIEQKSVFDSMQCGRILDAQVHIFSC